jgi:hypothetical protein
MKRKDERAHQRREDLEAELELDENTDENRPEGMRRASDAVLATRKKVQVNYRGTRRSTVDPGLPPSVDPNVEPATMNPFAGIKVPHVRLLFVCLTHWHLPSLINSV